MPGGTTCRNEYPARRGSCLRSVNLPCRAAWALLQYGARVVVGADCSGSACPRRRPGGGGDAAARRHNRGARDPAGRCKGCSCFSSVIASFPRQDALPRIPQHLASILAGSPVRVSLQPSSAAPPQAGVGRRFPALLRVLSSPSSPPPPLTLAAPSARGLTGAGIGRTASQRASGVAEHAAACEQPEL